MGNATCQFDIMAHNENGYVVYCNECSHYQLAFGTMVMTVSAEQFQKFHGQLVLAKEESANDPFPHQKTIRMPVGATHIRMALSPGEAEQLLILFEETQATKIFRNLMEEIQWK